MTSGKRWSKGVLILPLLLAATWAANAANTVENFRVKGDTVTALFDAPDPADSCLENTVIVVSSDVIEKVSPGERTPTTRTLLLIGQSNVCMNFLLFAGQGETADLNFQVAGDVRSATLTATVQMFDEVSQQLVDVQVNLAWQATADPQFVHTKETFQDPDVGIKIKLQSRSTLAEATATGTVSLDGYNFTPQASDSATIQKQNDGALTLQRTP